MISRDAWVAARRESLGSSDSPAILGCPGAGDALTVWESKVRPVREDRDEALCLTTGRLMEPVILALFRHETGLDCELTDPYATHRHSSVPWLTATPDAFCWEGDSGDAALGIVELKAVGEYRRSEWADGPPLRVQVQVQHQLAVLPRATFAYVVGLIGLNQLAIHRIEADPEFWAAAFPRLADFWSYVERREIPPAWDCPSAQDVLTRLHPDDSGAVVELPPRAEALTDAIERWTEQRKALESSIDTARNELRHMIGDATYGRLADGSGWKWATREVEYKPRPATTSKTRVLTRAKKVKL